MREFRQKMHLIMVNYWIWGESINKMLIDLLAKHSFWWYSMFFGVKWFLWIEFTKFGGRSVECVNGGVLILRHWYFCLIIVNFPNFLSKFNETKWRRGHFSKNAKRAIFRKMQKRFVDLERHGDDGRCGSASPDVRTRRCKQTGARFSV